MHNAAFETNFKLDSNQDMRTEYAREFLAEQGPYNPPSQYQFREPGDPAKGGHTSNFHRFVGSHEPCLRPLEPNNTGKYVPPSSYSFRPPSPDRQKMDLLFRPLPPEKDIGTRQKFERLPLDHTDPYLAHKSFSADVTLSKMPKMMLSEGRTNGPLL